MADNLPSLSSTPALVDTDAATIEARLPEVLDQWSRGETTLRDIYGYSDEELYGIAQQAYLLMMEGKLDPARTIFEGLVAIDPKNDYYYRALGVLYHRLGDPDKALKQFTYAIKVNGQDLVSYVNRAEIYCQQGNAILAEQNLQHVLRLCAKTPTHPMAKKANAMLKTLPLYQNY